MTGCLHGHGKIAYTPQGQTIEWCLDCGHVRGHYTKAEIIEKIRAHEAMCPEVRATLSYDDFICFLEANL
jgi:hypothetical protein